MTFALILSVASAMLIGKTAKADPSEEMVWFEFLEKQTVTDEQKAQVRPILEANAKARLTIWKKIGVTPGQMPTLTQMRTAGPDMRKVVAETDKQLEKVLTEQQMRAFVGIRDALREQMQAQAHLLEKN